jgi:ABC-type phosphate transport system auxiliary subunit
MEKHTSAESLRNVNNLVQKIDSLCKDIEKALAFCLEVNSGAVAEHSIALTKKMDSEFVDRIVVALHNMKNHLNELKKGIRNFRSTEEMQEVVRSLMQSSDALQQLLMSNNFFYNTFQLLISEVQVMIDRVLEEVPVMN